jgi:hypothetical protein
MRIATFTAVAVAVPFAVAAAGQAPDPEARKAQVNAQADLLQAVRGINLAGVASAKIADGGGIDIYL